MGPPRSSPGRPTRSTFIRRERLIALAARHSMPAIYDFRAYAEVLRIRVGRIDEHGYSGCARHQLVQPPRSLRLEVGG